MVASLAVVSLPHLPLLRFRNRQVLTEDVTGATIATKGVGVKNMAANDEMTVGVAVIATSTVTEVVVQVATGEMRGLRTVVQGYPNLNEIIVLLSGLHPHHPDLPSGALVLDTMTTGDEILPHHHDDPTTTAPGSRTYHQRMALLGVSKKTCTEGMVGLTKEVTILNGKCAMCAACQKPHHFLGVGNSVPIALSVSGHRHLVHPLGNCAGSLLFTNFVVADLFIVGHRNDAKNHAKGRNENVPPLSRPRQQIVTRIGGVVKEKKRSELGRKGTETNDHGGIEDHDLVRTTNLASAIAIAGGNAAGRQVASVAKLGLQRGAHAAPSQVMAKTTG